MWTFPFEISTSRLVLRQWRQTDATAVWTLLSDQLADLGQPTPEPHDAAGVTRPQHDPQDSTDGTHQTDWVYAIRHPASDEAIGFVGLHRRGAAGLELGYWLMAASRGRGYTIESVRAAVHVCFEQPGLQHVQICCDPTNEPSMAVARRLGFHLTETLPAVTHAEAHLELMVWRLTRDAYRDGERERGPDNPQIPMNRDGSQRSADRADQTAPTAGDGDGSAAC